VEIEEFVQVRLAIGSRMSTVRIAVIMYVLSLGGRSGKAARALK
jgi:hypothetical protein